ncbi:unnamed protein product [Notodromas monacha]|uniref:Daxx histone-binding domain-containing protein n=1 Tax=Notodromas monacha TaxID=399045 RepID=A0A7R9GA32_9CRUS|nr:unnamed protein product [Notodromas monacha]CAG0914905.1 unnamed protein product [Notodromas monacha]
MVLIIEKRATTAEVVNLVSDDEDDDILEVIPISTELPTSASNKATVKNEAVEEPLNPDPVGTLDQLGSDNSNKLSSDSQKTVEIDSPLVAEEHLRVQTPPMGCISKEKDRIVPFSVHGQVKKEDATKLNRDFVRFSDQQTKGKALFDGFLPDSQKIDMVLPLAGEEVIIESPGSDCVDEEKDPIVPISVYGRAKTEAVTKLNRDFVGFSYHQTKEPLFDGFLPDSQKIDMVLPLAGEEVIIESPGSDCVDEEKDPIMPISVHGQAKKEDATKLNREFVGFSYQQTKEPFFDGFLPDSQKIDMVLPLAGEEVIIESPGSESVDEERGIEKPENGKILHAVGFPEERSPNEKAIPVLDSDHRELGSEVCIEPVHAISSIRILKVKSADESEHEPARKKLKLISVDTEDPSQKEKQEKKDVLLGKLRACFEPVPENIDKKIWKKVQKKWASSAKNLSLSELQSIVEDAEVLTNVEQKPPDADESFFWKVVYHILSSMDAALSSSKSACPSSSESVQKPKDEKMPPSKCSDVVGVKSDSAGDSSRDVGYEPSTSELPGKDAFKVEEASTVDDGPHAQKIVKLERHLRVLLKKLRELELQEVNFDEEEASAYCLQDRLRKRVLKIDRMICKFRGERHDLDRPSKKRFTFKESEIPQVNQKIMQLVNQKKIFPDFVDVKRIVEEHKPVMWSDEETDLYARKMFRLTGQKLKNRRLKETQQGLKDTEESFAKDLGLPVKVDEIGVLKEALDKNKMEGEKRMEEVCDTFVRKQELLGMKPIEVPDEDADLSESDDHSDSASVEENDKI